jgi:hypothetical protein
MRRRLAGDLKIELVELREMPLGPAGHGYCQKPRGEVFHVCAIAVFGCGKSGRERFFYQPAVPQISVNGARATVR